MELTDSLQYLKGVGPKRLKSLEKLGLSTIYDLLTWYPRTYEDRSVLTPLSNLQTGEMATISGQVLSLNERQGGRRRMTILTAVIGDGTGFVSVTWFNQKYLKQQLKLGTRVFVTGKAEYAYGGRGMLAMSKLSGFQILKADESGEEKMGILPVYPASMQLNQTFFRKLTTELLTQVQSGEISIPEVIPQAILQKFGLLPRKEAFLQIHYPDSLVSLKQARERLAFEELYLIQCGLLVLKKRARQQKQGIAHQAKGKLLAGLLAELPFQLTHDQRTVWQEISKDMESPLPMRRLVQGDVGSGKTIIAMLALVKTVENGYQGALMAPTEILASQHYESFTKLLTPLGVRIGFLSGHLTKKKREGMYAQIASHEADIVIGTHALIQEGVTFAKLGLVVTDEQHRFGIEQRAALEKKGELLPDVLVMTATPIPRTMTLTVYGDLDVSQIKELPPGRKPVRTFLRRPDRRELIYQYVHGQLEAGRQAYVVCPRIEMDEESDLPSAEEVYDELRYGMFRDMSVGLLHGKMKNTEKEQLMQDFYAGKIQLLVATTVIEVGVNVPNASIMVIEHAERFGLAQLHQLRGRIGRGSYQSFCILVSEMKTAAAKERLEIMVQTSDGFKLAEEDLKLRGPGQFFGAMQHGLPDLKIADVLQDTNILLKARQAALLTLKNQGDMQHILPILALQYREHFANITEN